MKTKTSTWIMVEVLVTMEHLIYIDIQSSRIEATAHTALTVLVGVGMIDSACSLVFQGYMAYIVDHSGMHV